MSTNNKITEYKEEEKEIIEICPNYAALGRDGEYDYDSMVADTSAQKIEDILRPPTMRGEDEETWAPV